MTNSDHTQHTLGDMLAFAAEMDQYVTALGEQNFYADRRTQLVAEALLHRLGEAVSRLDRDSPSFIQDHPEIEWAKIKAMRNIVAHEYGFIDYRMVWRALSLSLPQDVEAIRRLVD